ncbi:MAG: GNAT family N-acetyltransferase [Anaerolineales bacterium]|nr:GNAT family N-acetyltransferase [Anaerolineales bacterium]
MDSIRIERIKLKDLPAVAARYVDGAAPGSFIPITKHRAAAMVHNPHATPDDVALLLALRGEQPVGYFGLAAVQLAASGQLHRVHWLTTWAVSHDMLGKGLGSQLMQAAIDLDVDLAIVGSAPARRVSAKFSFQEAPSLDYVRLDFEVTGRYNPLGLLLRALRKLASLAGVQLRIERLQAVFHRLFETLFGWLLRPLLFWLVARVVGTRLRAQHAGLAPLQAPQDFAVPAPSETGFTRDAAVLNWTLQHPWVLPDASSASAALDYEFTDWRPGFEIFAVGNAQDYTLFQFSHIRGRGVLKALDSTLPPGRLLAAALHTARSRGAHIIEGEAALAQPLPAWLRRLLVRRLQRTLQLHPRSASSPLAQALAEGGFVQHYTDGDMAFT